MSAYSERDTEREGASDWTRIHGILLELCENCRCVRFDDLTINRKALLNRLYSVQLSYL